MRGARLWPAPHLLRLGPTRSSPPRMPTPALRNFFTSSSPLARLQRRSLFDIFRADRSFFARRFRSFRFNSDKAGATRPNPTPNLGSPEPPLCLSQKLKKLSREYGWSAFGVYMALTALDFPFCFLAVRSLGTDRIGHYEHVVVQSVKNFFGLGESNGNGESSVGAQLAEATAREGELGLADDIEEAEAANQGAGASIWTELALAYAIHKSFIFIRVPLTAAITPKVVKTLRSWGWNIGKRKPKSLKAS